MASITIRNLDAKVKSKLRVRAAEHGRSMEAEAREILTRSLNPAAEKEGNLWERIRRQVEPFGGVDLKIPPRRPVTRRSIFEE